MKRLAIFSVLVALPLLSFRPAPAQEPVRPAHLELALEFLDAFHAHTKSALALLAAKPPHSVAYTLVAQELLIRGELDAARALAEARAEGPEGPGLTKLIETYQKTGRPTLEQEQAVLDARGRNEARDSAGAFKALEAAGEPVEGTVLGPRILWERASAFFVADRRAEGLKTLAECARLAAAVGWWDLAQNAQRKRLEVAKAGQMVESAFEAANGYVEAATKLGQIEHRFVAHRERALLAQLSGQQRLARADLKEAADLARKLERYADATLLLGRLALIYQLIERQPKQALRIHDQSLELARQVGEPELIQFALLNSAICLTDLARYDEALVRLEEILGTEAEMTRETLGRARGQRAYVLQRLGRLESSRKAYYRARASMPEGELRLALLSDYARLQVLRGDYHSADDLFAQLLEEDPDSVIARAGQATCRAARGDEVGADAGFDQAVEKCDSDVKRGRILLQRAAAERSQGRLEEALSTARKALQRMIDAEGEDHGNTAAAWTILGDVMLMGRKFKEAVKILESSSVYLFKLADPLRSIPAYVRETLILMSLDEQDLVRRRFQTLLHLAEGSSDPGLRSAKKIVAALMEERAGRHKEALALIGEAIELADETHHPVRRATALAYRAMLDADGGLDAAEEALRVLDARRVNGFEAQPLVVGEHPWFATSIAARTCFAAKGLDEKSRTARLFELAQRARWEHVQLALGGRESILYSTLPRVLHREYAKIRGTLIEARAVGEQVVESENDFDAWVGRLREDHPRVADLAFFQPVPLAAAQAVLREDEALLLQLDDDFARFVVAVTRTAAVAVKDYEVGDPLAAVAELIQGKRRLLIAPDGSLAGIPWELAKWKDAIAADAFDLSYLPSVRTLLRWRGPEATEPASGAGVVGSGPPELGTPLEAPPTDRLALLWFGDEGRLRLSFDRAETGRRSALTLLREGWKTDLALFPSTHALAGPAPRGAAPAALVEALACHGARQVIVSILGETPPALLDRLRKHLDEGKSPAEALKLAKAWARSENPDLVSWAGLALYAAP